MTKGKGGSLTKLMRYGLTGGLAAIVDLGGFAATLALGMSLPIAATLSFLTATVVNYLLSASFVFGSVISPWGYLRFLVFAGLGLLTNVAITIVADAVGLPAVLAKLAGIAIAFGVNFLLNLAFVFPQNNRKED